MSQQNLTVPLGPHKSQVSGACDASAQESIRTSFVFPERGTLGSIKHSWKERDRGYLSQLKHCFGKEMPLKQPAPAW